MKFCVTTFLLLCTTCLFAQKKQGQELIDSLIRELPTAKDDTNKVNLLNTLSFRCYGIKPDDGINFAEQALKLSLHLEFKKGIANSYNNIGIYKEDQNDFANALKYDSAALKIREEINDKNGLAGSYGNIATIYFDHSNFQILSPNSTVNPSPSQ